MVPLAAYFEGNDFEECIAPNQWVSVARRLPSCTHAWPRSPKSLKWKVSTSACTKTGVKRLEDDSEWPAAENVHVLTSADVETVEGWLQGLECDGVGEGWPYGEHVDAPIPGRPPRADRVLGLVDPRHAWMHFAHRQNVPTRGTPPNGDMPAFAFEVAGQRPALPQVQGAAPQNPPIAPALRERALHAVLARAHPATRPDRHRVARLCTSSPSEYTRRSACCRSQPSATAKVLRAGHGPPGHC